MNQFEMKDELGRQLFIKQFASRFKCIVATALTAKHDLNLTGLTDCTYANEIKVRKDASTDHNSSTIIEDSKVQYFKEIMKHDKKRTCLYTVFFTDDGVVITYNITARIREAEVASNRWKFASYYKKCQNNNTGNSYTIPKAVHDLTYTPAYGDRKNKYEIIENNCN